MNIFTKIPKKHFRYAITIFVQTLLLLFLMAQFSKNFMKNIDANWRTCLIVVAIVCLFFCVRYTINFQNNYFENDDDSIKHI
jgi:ABC-type uncharacterized transport system permease subunit